MKKLFASILAILYLTISSGATVHMHYCMGELADWSLWHNKSQKCGNCGMHKSEKKDKGCCKDEQKLVKLKSDQKVAESYQIVQLNSVATPVEFFELPAIHILSVTEENPLSHAPPRIGSIAVYIRNCVFRI